MAVYYGFDYFRDDAVAWFMIIMMASFEARVSRQAVAIIEELYRQQGLMAIFYVTVMLCASIGPCVHIV